MKDAKTPSASDNDTLAEFIAAESTGNAALDATLAAWGSKGDEFETGEFWKPENVGDKLVIRVENIGKSKFGALLRGVTEGGDTRVVGVSANLRSKLPADVTERIIGFVYTGEQKTDNGQMKVYRTFEFRSFADARVG